MVYNKDVREEGRQTPSERERLNNQGDAYYEA